MNPPSSKDANIDPKERRRYPRFQPKKMLFSALKYNGDYIVGDVIDISKGGLSFKYLFDIHQVFLGGNGTTYEIEIFSPEANISMQGVKCKVVYSTILPGAPVSLLKVIKCGLMFNVSDDQIYKNIDELIEKSVA